MFSKNDLLANERIMSLSDKAQEVHLTFQTDLYVCVYCVSGKMSVSNTPFSVLVIQLDALLNNILLRLEMDGCIFRNTAIADPPMFYVCVTDGQAGNLLANL